MEDRRRPARASQPKGGKRPLIPGCTVERSRNGGLGGEQGADCPREQGERGAESGGSERGLKVRRRKAARRQLRLDSLQWTGARLAPTRRLMARRIL